MKKLFFISAVTLFIVGFTSCTCECIGPNDNDPTNKVCKTDYENANGAGSWGSYESAGKAAGWVCK